MDVRYQRKPAELTVQVPDGIPASILPAALAERFHAEHERTYGYRRSNESIAVVNLRLKALAPAHSVTFAELGESFLNAAGANRATEPWRSAFFGAKTA